MSVSPRDDDAAAREAAAITLAEYDRMAEAYRHGTADHDVSQNIAALLDAIEGEAPHAVLDLGCGPGRDLCAFTALGHEVVGLDGSAPLVALAQRRELTARCCSRISWRWTCRPRNSTESSPMPCSSTCRAARSRASSPTSRRR